MAATHAENGSGGGGTPEKAYEPGGAISKIAGWTKSLLYYAFIGGYPLAREKIKESAYERLRHEGEHDRDHLVAQIRELEEIVGQDRHPILNELATDGASDAKDLRSVLIELRDVVTSHQNLERGRPDNEKGILFETHFRSQFVRLRTRILDEILPRVRRRRCWAQSSQDKNAPTIERKLHALEEKFRRGEEKDIITPTGDYEDPKQNKLMNDFIADGLQVADAMDTMINSPPELKHSERRTVAHFELVHRYAHLRDHLQETLGHIQGHNFWSDTKLKSAEGPPISQQARQVSESVLHTFQTEGTNIRLREPNQLITQLQKLRDQMSQQINARHHPPEHYSVWDRNRYIWEGIAGVTQVARMGLVTAGLLSIDPMQTAKYVGAKVGLVSKEAAPSILGLTSSTGEKSIQDIQKEWAEELFRASEKMKGK